MFKKSIAYFKKYPEKLILMDAVGALISAIFLGVIMVQLNRYFLVPNDVLFLLTIFPVFFFVVDLIFLFAFKNLIRKGLRLVAFLNLMYCLVSFAQVLKLDTLALMAYVYFSIEIVLLICLSYIQFKTAWTD